MGKNQISSFACNTIKTFSNNDKWKEQRDVNQLHVREREKKKALDFNKNEWKLQWGFSHHHLAWQSFGTCLTNMVQFLSVNLECDSIPMSSKCIWPLMVLTKPSPRFSTCVFRWQPSPVLFLLSSSHGLYAVDPGIRSPSTINKSVYCNIKITLILNWQKTKSNF